MLSQEKPGCCHDTSGMSRRGFLGTSGRVMGANGRRAFRMTALAVLALVCRLALAEPPRAVDGNRLRAVTSRAAHSADAAAPRVRISDVIYGRKDGMALTMDVLKPPEANGAAVIWVASGGLRSNHGMIAGDGFVRYVEPLLKRGYTVFAVVHGSMPKYEIREITADFHRAVQFIRHHAKDFGIDPNRVGISGGSSGGSLSLLIGTTGRVSNPKARDPVERQSSRVQAVACFYPGTDWVNFEREGISVLGVCQRLGLIEGFRFRRFDPTAKEHVLITNPKQVEELLREYSPINRVTAESAPTLIIHGDKDDLVPLDQSERMIAKLKAAGVTAELVVKKGEGHGWGNQTVDMERFADWYDKHLARKGS